MTELFYTPHKETWDDLCKMNVTKEHIFKGLEFTFDYALPQTWLNMLVNQTGIDYNVVISTTVWGYPPKFLMGIPITACVEVQQAIDKFNKG